MLTTSLLSQEPHRHIKVLQNLLIPDGEKPQRVKSEQRKESESWLIVTCHGKLYDLL